MAINRIKTQFAYGPGDAFVKIPPLPIVAARAPGTRDLGVLGQLWVDTSAGVIYGLASIANGASNWTSTPAAGATILASLTVNPGNATVTAGNLDVTAGDFNVGGNSTFVGNVTIGGTTTLNGDIDITSAQLIDLTSTLDAAPSILLHANGGTSEQILLHSDQGTAVDSVSLLSDVGGLTLQSGLASADAININATAGGVDIDGALQVNIASSQNAASSIVITSSAGGIDILANGAGAGEDIDIQASSSINLVSTENAAQAIYLRANGGVTETIQLHADQGTAVNSLNLLSDVGGLTLRATGLASPDAINLEAVAGGVDVDAALQINVASSQVAADALRFVASDAAGGIDVDAGTGGVAIDSTGAVSIQGGAASDFSVGGAGIDLSLVSAAGRVVVNGEEAAPDAVRVLSAAGGLDVNVALQMNLDSSQAAAADSVRIVASAADGGIDVDAGTGGIAIDSTGAVSIQGGAASDFSVGGAGIDLSLVSAAGRVVVNGEEAAPDAVRILSAAGGLDVNVALQMNLDSSQAAVANAVRIVASAADGGIDVDAGTGGITLDSTGAISVDGAAASNVSVSGAGIDLTLASAAGRVVVDGGEAAADAVTISASNAAGGLDLNAGSGGVAIDAASGSIALTAGTGGNGTITLTSTGSGDIVLNSDDTMLLDADGVLELNSSAGAINIGNDADAQAINIGSAGVRPIQVGNASAGTTVLLLGPANIGITLQNSIRIMTGAGSPDTVVSAPAGSLWLRTDPAGATSRIYVNTDSATAWTNVTCAA